MFVLLLKVIVAGVHLQNLLSCFKLGRLSFDVQANAIDEFAELLK